MKPPVKPRRPLLPNWVRRTDRTTSTESRPRGRAGEPGVQVVLP